MMKIFAKDLPKNLLLCGLILFLGFAIRNIIDKVLDRILPADLHNFYANTDNMYGTSGSPEYSMYGLITALSLALTWFLLVRFTDIRLPKFEVPYKLIGVYFAILSFCILFIVLYDVFVSDEPIEFEKPLKLLYTSVVVAFAAPLAEEIIFRGVILGFLLTFMSLYRGWNVNIAIVLAAFAFGAVHMGNTSEYQSFIQSVLQSVMSSSTGIFYGYVYLLTGRLWLTVSMHAMNNLIATLGTDTIVSDPTELLTANDLIEQPLIMIFASLLLIWNLVFVYLMYKRWLRIKDDWHASCQKATDQMPKLLPIG